MLCGVGKTRKRDKGRTLHFLVAPLTTNGDKLYQTKLTFFFQNDKISSRDFIALCRVDENGLLLDDPKNLPSHLRENVKGKGTYGTLDWTFHSTPSRYVFCYMRSDVVASDCEQLAISTPFSLPSLIATISVPSPSRPASRSTSRPPSRLPSVSSVSSSLISLSLSPPLHRPMSLSKPTMDTQRTAQPNIIHPHLQVPVSLSPDATVSRADSNIESHFGSSVQLASPSPSPPFMSNSVENRSSSKSITNGSLVDSVPGSSSTSSLLSTEVYIVADFNILELELFGPPVKKLLTPNTREQGLVELRKVLTESYNTVEDKQLRSLLLATIHILRFNDWALLLSRRNRTDTDSLGFILAQKLRVRIQKYELDLTELFPELFLLLSICSQISNESIRADFQDLEFRLWKVTEDTLQAHPEWLSEYIPEMLKMMQTSTVSIHGIDCILDRFEFFASPEPTRVWNTFDQVVDILVHNHELSVEQGPLINSSENQLDLRVMWNQKLIWILGVQLSKMQDGAPYLRKWFDALDRICKLRPLPDVSVIKGFMMPIQSLIRISVKIVIEQGFHTLISILSKLAEFVSISANETQDFQFFEIIHNVFFSLSMEYPDLRAESIPMYIQYLSLTNRNLYQIALQGLSIRLDLTARYSQDILSVLKDDRCQSVEVLQLLHPLYTINRPPFETLDTVFLLLRIAQYPEKAKPLDSVILSSLNNTLQAVTKLSRAELSDLISLFCQFLKGVESSNMNLALEILLQIARYPGGAVRLVPFLEDLKLRLHSFSTQTISLLISLWGEVAVTCSADVAGPFVTDLLPFLTVAESDHQVQALKQLQCIAMAHGQQILLPYMHSITDALPSLANQTAQEIADTLLQYLQMTTTETSLVDAEHITTVLVTEDGEYPFAWYQPVVVEDVQESLSAFCTGMGNQDIESIALVTQEGAVVDWNSPSFLADINGKHLRVSFAGMSPSRTVFQSSWK
eukprot:GILK01011281.1.p1 GENE.GILK01011281.1~~GILK01011281.1.p1  ORF type:complete len:969 (+),score=155.84 GILK01011281.1:54-2960(+)